MAETARGQVLKLHVVLGVWRRHDHRARTRELEHGSLERREPRRFQVLDHLDDRSGLVAGEPPVSIHEGTLEELDALPLLLGHLLEPEPIAGDLQGSMRHVDADDLVEGLLLEERSNELALAAAEVQDPLGAALFESGDHRSDALLVQADPLLDLRLFLGVRGLEFVGCRQLVSHQPFERIASQAALVLQVAPRDGLALGMRRQPSLAPANQLVDFVVANPVVLVVVQNGNKHVEMREQIAEPLGARDRYGEIAARAPVAVLLIEGVLLGAHLVAERLEEPPQECLAAAAGKNREASLERKLAARQLGPLLAAPRERRPEHLRDRDAEERGRHVGPIVDVLLEGPSLAGRALPTPHEPDRIDVKEQSGGAAVRLGLRVEDVRLSEGEAKRVRTKRVLVQQVPEVCGRRGRASDRQQHE